jgi:hypothetical protein
MRSSGYLGLKSQLGCQRVLVLVLVLEDLRIQVSLSTLVELGERAGHRLSNHWIRLRRQLNSPTGPVLMVSWSLDDMIEISLVIWGADVHECSDTLIPSDSMV